MSIKIKTSQSVVNYQSYCFTQFDITIEKEGTPNFNNFERKNTTVWCVQ